jgi:RNA polymerase sigma-70 factor, ECF subfamily
MNSTIERVRTAPTSLADWTDEDLLGGYRQEGERRLFEELVRRYERELYSYLRRYLGNAEMAEDAFQQTFLQVHLKCGQYEPGRKVRPWLYTVATNQAIDAQRRNRRHRMVSLDRRMGSDDADAGALVDMLVQDEAGPVELLESSEHREFVRQEVDRLPEPLGQVVNLVYYQGLKYREAADVLSIPVGTVKSRLHAAIQKLNELLTRNQLPQ